MVQPNANMSYTFLFEIFHAFVGIVAIDIIFVTSPPVYIQSTTE